MPRAPKLMQESCHIARQSPADCKLINFRGVKICAHMYPKQTTKRNIYLILYQKSCKMQQRHSLGEHVPRLLPQTFQIDYMPLVLQCYQRLIQTRAENYRKAITLPSSASITRKCDVRGAVSTCSMALFHTH